MFFVLLFDADHMAFPQMMGPPPHGLPWDPTLGRGFLPNFRDQFPVGLPRPGGESPGRPRSDEDSEYASSEDERRREREHKKRDKEKDRERSREHRERYVSKYWIISLFLLLPFF